MLSKEVLGWRVLAVLLLLLIIPTIPQFEYIQNEWENSIDNLEKEEENQSENEFSAETEPSEENIESDSSRSDEESADDSAEFALAESDVPEADAKETPFEKNSIENWVLPATQVIVLTMMAIMAVGLLTSTTTAIILSESARYSILLAVLGPLLAIANRGEKGVFTRGRILGFIEAHPGIHFSALRDALGLGNGVTAHHIQVLEKEGRIISWLDSKVRRFATSGIDQIRLKELQSPATGMQVAILQILSEADTIGIKSKDLREKLQTSRQLLSYHMKHLKDRDIVISVGKGRATHWKILEKGESLLKSSIHLNEI